MIIDGDRKIIAGAFIKARAEIGGTVAEDARGNFGKYVTLAAIAKATTGILAKHGLAIIQEAEVHEGGVTIETHLLHESGATMQFSPLTMPLTRRDAQSVGSAISYGRRYQWTAVCGLAGSDDDGQQATDAQSKAQRTSGEISPMEKDVDLWRTDAPATADEIAILSGWDSPVMAKAWAVAEGACLSDIEAGNSFKKIVDGHGGRLTKENIAIVYLEFLRRQNEKLSALKATVAA